MGQWLGLCRSTAEGTGSIPGQAARIPQAILCSQKKKNYFSLTQMTSTDWPIA